MKGNQPRPWSNYLFAEEIIPHNAEENAEYEAEVQKLLEEDPNLLEDMESIKEKNEKLMEKINQYQEDNVHHDEK